ncbi:MAG: alpha-amylase family glycosyl hydrolase, partial [Fidelibacterota bacterium]
SRYVSEDTSFSGAEIYSIGLIHEIYSSFLKSAYEKLGDHIEIEMKNLHEQFEPDLLDSFIQYYHSKDTDRNQKQTLLTGISIATTLWLDVNNPALKKYTEIIPGVAKGQKTLYESIISNISTISSDVIPIGSEKYSLLELMHLPSKNEPDSIQKQLEWILNHWGDHLGHLRLKLLRGIDFLQEETKFRGEGPGPAMIPDFSGYSEPVRFSSDAHWMPNVVLLAKNVYVWLVQLSGKYQCEIRTLYDIPDEELDWLADSGFTALWLIGIWQRSPASKRIKHLCGNPEAEASAYSLFNYRINDDIGGESALEQLKDRCSHRGIRMACDVVPNHTGIDSQWIRQHPDWYIQTDRPPFPGYSFNGENLSHDTNIGIYLEDHYYSKEDASVVFKYVHHQTAHTRYIYHGNDGTSMPWNDTAQLNYLMPEVREAIIRLIIHIARQFPIIRFDAAMTLTKQHFQRLWYPEAGSGSDIPSRSAHGLTKAEFDKLFPEEFWREVVDRVASEAPDTLLLAEAFWMMEGYFVRSLGMHRVYNSAFMNMLKMEENAKYRRTIKNVLSFDPEILKRFVNFLNNPDEDSAAVQFGTGDKYFGVAILMITMPGTPMFGHGQVEGFHEKYGMEFSQPYLDEMPNKGLIDRHHMEVFPLLKVRYLFSESKLFRFFDFVRPDDQVNENVFAYINGIADKRVIVVYNNSFEQTAGNIEQSVGINSNPQEGDATPSRYSVAESLGLSKNEGKFVIFRVHPDGVYLIRSVHEINYNGLHFILSGYQYQIMFVESVRSDDVDHHLSALYLALDGRSIGNLDAELERIRYREIHRSLADLIIYFSISDFFKKSSKGNEFPQEISALLDKFSNEISKFTDRKNARLLKRSLRNSFTNIHQLSGILPSDVHLRDFTLIISALLKYVKNVRADHFNVELACDLKGSLVIPNSPEIDKLPDQAVLRLFVNLIEFSRKLHTEKLPVLIKNLVVHPETLKFINVHEFEGAYWFEKEKFQSVLKHIFTIVECELLLIDTVQKMNDIEAHQFIDRLGDIISKFGMMAEQSGYNWDKYLDLLDE